MKSQLNDAQKNSTQMDNAMDLTTTRTNDDFARCQLEEIEESISIITNAKQTLNEDGERLKEELVECGNKSQRLTDDISNVKLGVEEEYRLLEATAQNLDLLHEDLMSLKSEIEDRQCVSYDGTFMWKITNVGEKLSK